MEKQNIVQSSGMNIEIRQVLNSWVVANLPANGPIGYGPISSQMVFNKIEDLFTYMKTLSGIV